MTQGELSQYLETKRPEQLLDLHEPLPKSTTTNDNELPDWTDPSILSKTESFQVSRNYKLPKELSTIIEDDGWINKGSLASNPKLRLEVDRNRKYILLVMHTKTYICFFMEHADSSNRFYKLDTNKLSVAGITPPFVHVFDNLKTAVAISTSGSVCLWKDFTASSTRVEYQIHLLSYNESITCIEFINREHILLGSSKGEIYLLKIENHTLSAFSLFMHKFNILNLFTQRQLPTLSDIQKSSCSINHIAGIHSTIGNQLYVLTDNSIQIWIIESNGKVNLLSNTNIIDIVRSEIMVLIPDHMSKEGIRFDILNMCVQNDNEMVIIASYSIAGLGDYVQYAVISFELDYDQPIDVKYTVSIPYTTIPTTLKYTPRLSVSDTMVFVTFDSTVIAVSTTRNSLFEESVVLNDDEVLYTSVEEIKDTTRATIFTLRSGVIHFEIDKKSICAPAEIGNIYARMEDTIKRDESVFKSKLEQAVFFGARIEPLLQFFLRPEGQLDISKIVMNLSGEISNGQCKFLPFINQTTLYVDARCLFEKKIVLVLKENHLLSLLSIENRIKLMQRLEFYYLAQVLNKLSFVRDFVTECWVDEIKSNLISSEGTNVSCKSIYEELIVNHTTDIVNVLKSYIETLKVEKNYAVNRTKLLENANILIMKMTRKSKNFEEKYAKSYSLEVDWYSSISGKLHDMLLDMFQINIVHIQKYSIDDMMESDSVEGINKYLCEIGSLLLQSYHDLAEIKQNEMNDKYTQICRDVIEGLCKTGLYEKAIELAEQHNDIPALVASVNTCRLSLEIIKQKNAYFLDLFKEDYFNCLLKYLDGLHWDREQKEILDLCNSYPDFASKFFRHNELGISWIYHLKRKEYEKAAYSIQKYLKAKNIDDKKRSELMGWMEVINATISCRNGDGCETL